MALSMKWNLSLLPWDSVQVYFYITRSSQIITPIVLYSVDSSTTTELTCPVCYWHCRSVFGSVTAPLKAGPLDPPQESYLVLIIDIDKYDWCASTSCFGLLSCSGQKESICWGLFTVAYWSTCGAPASVCGSRTVYVGLSQNKHSITHSAKESRWGNPTLAAPGSRTYRLNSVRAGWSKGHPINTASNLLHWARALFIRSNMSKGVTFGGRTR